MSKKTSPHPISWLQLAPLLVVFHLVSGAPLNLTEICSDNQENLIDLGTEQKNPEINPDLFEGDILGISSVEEAKNAMLSKNLYWPDGIIYYAFDPSYPHSHTELVEQIMEKVKAEFEDKTCLRLEERTDEQNYVNILYSVGCSSEVGMRGNGAQIMTLNENCYYNGGAGSVIHEFMHAAGFHHEQSRTDRDKYVFVNYTNIQPGMEQNFAIYGENIVTSLGEHYDLGSLMHYGKYGFAINRNIPTITARNPITNQPDPSINIGQREGLSQIDIDKLNKIYKCPEYKDLCK